MCIAYFYFVLWVSHACDCALCPHQWCMIPSHTYLSMAMEFIHKFRFNHYIVIPGNERKFAHAHHAVRFMRCICIQNMDRIIRSNQCNVSATQKSMHCIFIVAVVAIGRLNDVFFVLLLSYISVPNLICFNHKILDASHWMSIYWYPQCCHEWTSNFRFPRYFIHLTMMLQYIMLHAFVWVNNIHCVLMEQFGNNIFSSSSSLCSGLVWISEKIGRQLSEFWINCKLLLIWGIMPRRCPYFTIHFQQFLRLILILCLFVVSYAQSTASTTHRADTK